MGGKNGGFEAETGHVVRVTEMSRGAGLFIGTQRSAPARVYVGDIVVNEKHEERSSLQLREIFSLC